MICVRPSSINLKIDEYSKVKEEIYALIGKLIITGHEFNTAPELMGKSAFMGEEATKVVEDHKIVPEEIEAMVNVIEAEVSRKGGGQA